MVKTIKKKKTFDQDNREQVRKKKKKIDEETIVEFKIRDANLKKREKK